MVSIHQIWDCIQCSGPSPAPAHHLQQQFQSHSLFGFSLDLGGNAMLLACSASCALMVWQRILAFTATKLLTAIVVASFPGSPPFFSLFLRVRILYAKNRRRGRAWYGAAPTRGHLASQLVTGWPQALRTVQAGVVIKPDIAHSVYVRVRAYACTYAYPIARSCRASASDSRCACTLSSYI